MIFFCLCPLRPCGFNNALQCLSLQEKRLLNAGNGRLLSTGAVNLLSDGNCLQAFTGRIPSPHESSPRICFSWLCTGRLCCKMQFVQINMKSYLKGPQLLRLHAALLCGWRLFFLSPPPEGAEEQGCASSSIRVVLRTLSQERNFSSFTPLISPLQRK